MEYIKNLELDEIRCGFLVTSHQKQSWNVQIELLMEFARICDKHHLKWFAAYGTLLGAVRHGGFIPWDSDIDVHMFRPDYERFKQIAPNEFRYPYQFDLWYENEDPDDAPSERFPLLPFIKLRDMRTTIVALGEPISIDVMPLDSFPSFEDEPNQNELDLRFREIYEIFFSACRTKFIREEIANPSGGEFMLGRERIKKIYDLPLRVRGKLLEDKASQFYFDSKYVSTLFHLCSRFNWIYERTWFDETIYLPFETISIPAPKEFDKVLIAYYNDWHKIVFKGMYSRNFSVNISPQEYFEEKFLPDNLTARSNSLRSRLNMDEIRGGIIVSSWKKKIWKAQLDLILELCRVCENFNLKFWAIGQTLFATRKLHGFDPLNDFVTFEMTQSDFEKLEFSFPYRLEKFAGGGGMISDERTSMIQFSDGKTLPRGIFIEIKTTDQIPDEIEYLPFEFTSIPTPKNFETPNRVERKFDGVLTSDISHEESSANIKRVILYHKAILIDLESPEN